MWDLFALQWVFRFSEFGVSRNAGSFLSLAVNCRVPAKYFVWDLESNCVSIEKLFLLQSWPRQLWDLCPILFRCRRASRCRLSRLDTNWVALSWNSFQKHFRSLILSSAKADSKDAAAFWYSNRNTIFLRFRTKPSSGVVDEFFQKRECRPVAKAFPILIGQK